MFFLRLQIFDNESGETNITDIILAQDADLQKLTALKDQLEDYARQDSDFCYTIFDDKDQTVVKSRKESA